MHDSDPPVPLGELATITMGQSPPSEVVTRDESGLPFLQGCAEFGLRFPVARVFCDPPLRVAREGSTLVSVRAPVGTTNVADQDYCIGRGLAAVRARPGRADSSFLLHAIQHSLPYLHRRSQGSTFLAIGSQDLRSMPVVGLPLEAQRRIGEVLAAFDDAIEETEADIAKKREVRVGLVDDLFTRGVSADGELRPSPLEAPALYQETELGWIPKEWQVAPIRQLFKRRVARGRAGLQIMSVTMSRGLVPRSSVERRVDSALPPEGHLLVRRGDIAYNMMRMWQGVMGQAEYDCMVSPAYVVMTPGRELDAQFAKYLLSIPSSIAWFKRLSYGVVDDRLRLYARDLERIPLAIPRALPEQIVVRERLRAADLALAETLASLEKLKREKLGVVHDLLIEKTSPQVAIRRAG